MCCQRKTYTYVKYENIQFETKGSFINDVTVLGGRGQWFCDNSRKALVIKPVKIGEGCRGVGGVVKILQNCVTSFMDDPKELFNKFKAHEIPKKQNECIVLNATKPKIIWEVKPRLHVPFKHTFSALYCSFLTLVDRPTSLFKIQQSAEKACVILVLISFGNQLKCS